MKRYLLHVCILQQQKPTCTSFYLLIHSVIYWIINSFFWLSPIFQLLRWFLYYIENIQNYILCHISIDILQFNFLSVFICMYVLISLQSPFINSPDPGESRIKSLNCCLFPFMSLLQIAFSILSPQCFCIYTQVWIISCFITCRLSRSSKNSV